MENLPYSHVDMLVSEGYFYFWISWTGRCGKYLGIRNPTKKGTSWVLFILDFYTMETRYKKFYKSEFEIKEILIKNFIS